MLLFRMKSAHQPVSLAVHGRLSVASVSPMKCLPATHYPLTTHSPLTTFRINTCKSVSKQRTLTTFRMNTYEKPGEGGPSRALPTTHRPLPTTHYPLSQCPHSIAHTSRHHGGVLPSARATHYSPPTTHFLSNLLFSYSYKSLFPEPLLFHIHTNPPGVWG